MPKTLQNNVWLLKFFDDREAFDPMAYGLWSAARMGECCVRNILRGIEGFPRSVACFVSASTNGCNLLRSEMEVGERVQTASICCDLLLHCCTSGSIPSICIRPEETERLWREASDRKRQRERERQSAEKLQQILINSHRRLHHLEQLTKHKKSWSILNLNKSNISFIRKKCT